MVTVNGAAWPILKKNSTFTKYARLSFVYLNKMNEWLSIKKPMAAEQNERIQRTVEKERKRLLNFIRKRVDNVADAEDILQDVFVQFTQYLRLGSDIDSLTGWLFAVTRNRITDWFRKKKEDSFSDTALASSEGDGPLYLSDILPDNTAQTDQPMVRKILLEAIMEAVDELPEEQRFVFLQHEVEGRSFKELAAATGVPVNTLLSRKRYAVLTLRESLASIYKDLLND